ncbi:MAG: hypothetical protein AAF943_05635 [Pseudomonadota bacterium]
MRIKKFAASEDGAVTVDWVVITAAVVALAGIAIIGIEGATGTAGDTVKTYLTDADPGEF